MFIRYASLAGYTLLIVMALAIGVVSLRYATFNPAVAPDELRPNMEAHPSIFVSHTLAAAIALLAGVWQFMPRTRRTAWHRIEGRIYVGACLIGAVAGFYIAFYSTAGPWATAGFAILAVLWFGATLTGYLFARRRNFVLHRRWMVRSYALTSAAITLRVIVAIGGAAGIAFYDAYVFAAWASWIINLALVETWLAYHFRPRRQASAALSSS
jgi:uncharacterized membrane protein